MNELQKTIGRYAAADVTRVKFHNSRTLITQSAAKRRQSDEILTVTASPNVPAAASPPGRGRGHQLGAGGPVGAAGQSDGPRSVKPRTYQPSVHTRSDRPTDRPTEENATRARFCNNNRSAVRDPNYLELTRPTAMFGQLLNR